MARAGVRRPVRTRCRRFVDRAGRAAANVRRLEIRTGVALCPRASGAACGGLFRGDVVARATVSETYFLLGLGARVIDRLR